MLISEAFELYRRDVIMFTNQSHKTEENHLICMRSLLSYVGDIEVSELDFEKVRSWKEHLSRTRSPQTVRNYIIKLRVVLAFLQHRKIESLDPALVPVPNRVDTVPVYLTKEEVAQCISATRRVKNKAIISLLYAYGLRVSELCKMNRGDIKEGRFTVIGKGGKARLCFVDQRTIAYLDAYLSGRDDNNPALFLSDSGHRITPGVIQETFKTVRKQTGLDVHPHTLRHSFATNLLQSNTNLYHVKEMLGHSSLATTQQYLHVLNHDLEQVYKDKHTV